MGGKTAVNHPAAKNMIGAFHQPLTVISDTATLSTLADRELRAGLAEVIKYGLIMDAAFVGWLEDNVAALLSRDAACLRHAIAISCRCKAKVVRADERETGQRALLNLGHTYGHALEALCGYGQLLHGEAVAIGMALAAHTSVAVGRLPTEAATRIEQLLTRAGFDLALPELEATDIVARMGLDKKVRGGQLRLVLLDDIGAARLVDDVSPEVVKGVLEDYGAR